MRHTIPFLLLLVTACKSPTSTPPSKGDSPLRLIPDGGYEVPEFKLTERNGAKVGPEDLRGKVWVATFVFTRCTGPCPQVTATVARLQSELADWPDVRFVTFTLDPDHDDPDELKKYADHFRADKERWLFLTGTEKEIQDLSQKGFHVSAVRNPDAAVGQSIDHDSRLLLVDKTGHMRAYTRNVLQGEKPIDLEPVKKLIGELRQQAGP